MSPRRLQALSLSTLTQINVWREVRTTGDDDQHDDYKARTPTCSAIAAAAFVLVESAWCAGADGREAHRGHAEAGRAPPRGYRYGHATHISNFECASDSPLLSAKLKEAHALLEAERLEAFAPTGKKADSATFTNPLDEEDARDDSDGDGDGEDGGGGGGDDNRT